MNNGENGPSSLFHQGNPEFWEAYEIFLRRESLKRFVVSPQNDLACRMRELLLGIQGEKQASITPIRPEFNWNYPLAWLVLRNETILDAQGAGPLVVVQAGDVMLEDRSFDRDVFITHAPRRELVGGYMLSGRWENMRGLFLPLFTDMAVKHAVALRLAQNTTNAKVTVRGLLSGRA